MAEKQFNKGDVIFHQGDEGNDLYQILEGSVGFYVSYDQDDRQKISEAGKGEFFGEMAVIDACPRSADAIALEDGTRIREISASDLNAFFREDPDSITGIMKVLSTRIRDLTDQYDNAKAAASRIGADPKPDEETARGLKKYLFHHRIMPKEMPAQSAETVREANAGSHSEGFAKSVVKYPKGTVICKEGDLVNCMYDIHWGRVGIYSKFGTSEQVQLTTLASDNFFGEMGMVSDQPRSATAVALDPDTTVEIIYPEDFKELFEKNPYKVDMILRHLSTRLRTLTNQYLDVCAKIAEKSGS